MKSLATQPRGVSRRSFIACAGVAGAAATSFALAGRLWSQVAPPPGSSQAQNEPARPPEAGSQRLSIAKLQA